MFKSWENLGILCNSDCVCLSCGLSRKSSFSLERSGWTWTHTDATVTTNCGGSPRRWGGRSAVTMGGVKHTDLPSDTCRALFLLFVPRWAWSPWSSSFRTNWTFSWRTEATCCATDTSSCCVWPAPSSARPASYCWTSPPPTSTPCQYPLRNTHTHHVCRSSTWSYLIFARSVTGWGRLTGFTGLKRLEI